VNHTASLVRTEILVRRLEVPTPPALPKGSTDVSLCDLSRLKIEADLVAEDISALSGAAGASGIANPDAVFVEFRGGDERCGRVFAAPNKLRRHEAGYDHNDQQADSSDGFPMSLDHAFDFIAHVWAGLRLSKADSS